MFSDENDFITREYWNSIPLSDKRAYLESRGQGEVTYPHIKDEESLLLVYERAMQARDHTTLSRLHLKCFSLKLLPLAASYDDLVTLSSLLQHRKPQTNNTFLQKALHCAAPLSQALLTTYIRSQVPP